MRRLTRLLLVASAAVPVALAARKPFSIHDDVLAYPQVIHSAASLVEGDLTVCAEILTGMNVV
jgi:hypothetical protein